MFIKISIAGTTHRYFMTLLIASLLLPSATAQYSISGIVLQHQQQKKGNHPGNRHEPARSIMAGYFRRACSDQPGRSSNQGIQQHGVCNSIRGPICT